MSPLAIMKFEIFDNRYGIQLSGYGEYCKKWKNSFNIRYLLIRYIVKNVDIISLVDYKERTSKTTSEQVYSQ